MAGEDLLDQRGSRSWHADDEDGPGRSGSERRARGEEVRGERLDGRVDCPRVSRPVEPRVAPLEAIGRLEMPERRREIPLVVADLAECKVAGDGARLVEIAPREHASDFLDQFA